MSMKRYQALDLAVLALVLCLLEAACAYALRWFTGEAYTLSVTLFIALLVMMRWGAWGIVHGALGGFVYAMLHGGGVVSLAAYTVGTVAVGLNLLWLRGGGSDRIRGSALYAALFGATGFVAVCLGRAAVACLAGGEAFVPTLVRFFSVDTLSALFTIVFILIARKQNGLFEPQRGYLIRLRREEEEQRRGA